MTRGVFSKPCAYVASVHWQWEEEEIVGLCLSTDAYALSDHHRGTRHYREYHNRPEDID